MGRSGLRDQELLKTSRIGLDWIMQVRDRPLCNMHGGFVCLSVRPSVCLDLTEMSKVLLLLQERLIANVKLHFIPSPTDD